MRTCIFNDYNDANEMTIESLRLLRPEILESLLGYMDANPIANISLYLQRVKELIGLPQNKNIDDCSHR